jgi:hypothetical protein
MDSLELPRERKINFRMDLREYGGRMLLEGIWLRIGTNGGPL